MYPVLCLVRLLAVEVVGRGRGRAGGQRSVCGTWGTSCTASTSICARGGYGLNRGITDLSTIYCFVFSVVPRSEPC